MNKTLADYARSLLVPVAQLSVQQAKGSGYSLSKEYTLEKKRLHVQPQKPDGTPWLKAHKLTLTVQKIDGFAQQITQGICELLVQKRCDEEDIEEVREVLKDEAKQQQSNLGQLQEILVKESVARIQRDAKVRYLRYLLKGIEEWKKRSIEGRKQGPQRAKDTQAIHFFTLLIDRLEMLDSYIRQTEKDTGYYQVTYQRQTFNYRDLFARADALNALPIIPEIDGFLGESTDKERREKTFVSGIKMKLNGGVHVHGGEGRSVFKYNVALLNPESAEYKKREQAARSMQGLWEKILRTALLYCFVFCYMDDANFRPEEFFEKHILPVLREGTEEQKIAVLKKLQQKVDTETVAENIDAMRNFLFNFLIQSSIGPARYEETLALKLDRSILVKDVNQMILQNIFFQETFDTKNGRAALKYMSVKKDSPDNQALCTLPLKWFSSQSTIIQQKTAETYSMTYEPGGIQALPSCWFR